MKHSFFVGTKYIFVPPNRSHYYWYVGREFKKFPEGFGLVAGYHFFPGALKKKFNLGFEYLIQSSHYNLMHWEDSTGYTSPVEIEDGKEYTIENLLGYNVMVKIFKGFYLNQSAGIGVSFIHTKYLILRAGEVKSEMTLILNLVFNISLDKTI
ncbi:MAG: hypothetical protein K2X86_11610 [Cytophagaceae bacterium]|nr:hypothetical protein [Cytophagaceae bacterium]